MLYMVIRKEKRGYVAIDMSIRLPLSGASGVVVGHSLKLPSLALHTIVSAAQISMNSFCYGSIGLSHISDIPSLCVERGARRKTTQSSSISGRY